MEFVIQVCAKIQNVVNEGGAVCVHCTAAVRMSALNCHWCSNLECPSGTVQNSQTVSKLDVLIYIQQDATLHSLLYLETALHVSGGTSTHHQERKQLYLQHLVFVTPLLLSDAIMGELELV